MKKELCLEIFKKHKNTNILKKIFILLIISILIEVFVCNYPAFRTVFAKNNDLKVDFKHIKSTNEIHISDIGVRVTSVNLIYKKPLTDSVIYCLTYVSEDEDMERKLSEKIIRSKDKHYINLDTHSKCKEIKIKLQSGSVIDIKEIVINHSNFNINIFRIFFIFSIALVINKLKDENLHKKKYRTKSIKQNYQIIAILGIVCVLIGIYTIEQKSSDKLWIEPKNVNPDDAILIQTESFLKGKINLSVKVSEELLNMEDPYNFSKRINDNVPYLTDMAYYNGNYYSYYGIAPIITLVLPFRALTGVYLHTYLFNLVYIFGIIFALYDVYRKLIQKYVKKISLCNFYLGYFAILIGSNILVSLRGAKYDIVTTCGILFILISISLAINLEKNIKYRKINLIGLGISMALIVLSKPNYILYYPLIIYLAWTSLKTLNTKEKIKNSIWAIVPLGIFGILQMTYNYLRFDNIFEFGAQYQLTSANMKYCMQFSFGKILLGFAEYIFKLPTIDLTQFPFIFLGRSETGIVMNEYCYRTGFIGLVAIPILWVFLYSKEILKNEKSDLKNVVRISIITVLVQIMITTIAAGISEPYALDFKCISTLIAVILLLKNLETKKDNKDSNKLFVILCIVTILLMLPIGLSTTDMWLSNIARPVTTIFRNIFEFWN